MELLNKHQINKISGGYVMEEVERNVIQMQYLAEIDERCPMMVETFTCPQSMLWYCAANDFGYLCGQAGGGLSSEPDGGVTCTIY